MQLGASLWSCGSGSGTYARCPSHWRRRQEPSGAATHIPKQLTSEGWLLRPPNTGKHHHISCLTPPADAVVKEGAPTARSPGMGCRRAQVRLDSALSAARLLAADQPANGTSCAVRGFTSACKLGQEYCHQSPVGRPASPSSSVVSYRLTVEVSESAPITHHLSTSPSRQSSWTPSVLQELAFSSLEVFRLNANRIPSAVGGQLGAAAHSQCASA